MFTGIIRNTGSVTKITKKKEASMFRIEVIGKLKLSNGDSISINGACMTVNNINKNTFEFYATEESIKLTNFKYLSIGDSINLEQPVKPNQGLDGHIVTGHIDDTGEVLTITNEILKIKHPKKLNKYIAKKGSITINGVSLTVAEVKSKELILKLIPYTIENTNFKNLKKGDKINIEIDIIARYLEKLIK